MINYGDWKHRELLSEASGALPAEVQQTAQAFSQKMMGIINHLVKNIRSGGGMHPEELKNYQRMQQSLMASVQGQKLEAYNVLEEYEDMIEAEIGNFTNTLFDQISNMYGATPQEIDRVRTVGKVERPVRTSSKEDIAAAIRDAFGEHLPKALGASLPSAMKGERVALQTSAQGETAKWAFQDMAPLLSRRSQFVIYYTPPSGGPKQRIKIGDQPKKKGSTLWLSPTGDNANQVVEKVRQNRFLTVHKDGKFLQQLDLGSETDVRAFITLLKTEKFTEQP